MRQVIYKYPLNTTSSEHRIPRDAVPVLVGYQRGRMWPSVWMKHRADFTDEDCGVFTFRVKSTGDVLEGEYIGSAIEPETGFYVWHITMQRPEPPIEILKKVEEPETWFTNYYKCPDAACGNHWIDEWSASSDDECPNCGMSNISPYLSAETKRR